MSTQILDLEPELLQLRTSLETLRAHIEAISKLEKVVAALPQIESLPPDLAGLRADLDRDFLNSPKRRAFEFNAVIISLAGFLETFIENILRAYLRGLREVSDNYTDLPPAVTAKHVLLSFQLIES
jgi:hypothetical protein